MLEVDVCPGLGFKAFACSRIRGRGVWRSQHEDIYIYIHTYLCVYIYIIYMIYIYITYITDILYIYIIRYV